MPPFIETVQRLCRDGINAVKGHSIKAAQCAYGSDDANSVPVDLDHLLEFASGDKKLAARFLRLFKDQAAIDLDHLAASVDAEGWRDAAHSLKSSASGIGAWRLVEASERAQGEDCPLNDELRKRYMEELILLVSEVTAFIESYLHQE